MRRFLFTIITAAAAAAAVALVPEMRARSIHLISTFNKIKHNVTAAVVLLLLLNLSGRHTVPQESKITPKVDEAKWVKYGLRALP